MIGIGTHVDWRCSRNAHMIYVLYVHVKNIFSMLTVVVENSQCFVHKNEFNFENNTPGCIRLEGPCLMLM